MPIVSLSETVNGAISGKVISFPTDTVPALATLPAYSPLIFATKQRPPDKPLILMGSCVEDLWPYVNGTPRELELWQHKAQKYLPGALTLVLPASAKVPEVMNPTDPSTIGIRVPHHPLARNLLAQTGPLATTSANLSGESPLLSMKAIAEKFKSILVLDEDEQSGSGLASTVVKWTGRDWQILRQGSVSFIEPQ